ncbi:MAG: GAF domain-containing protein, partial [Spirochaetes bacterium]|nr:GAF domain-containing protein [Spirochaetota bacterium]
MDLKNDVSTPSKKILLVEDEPLIALSEATFLRKQGYEVFTVSNGMAAIRAVEQDPLLDLILMDIDLGQGMDGTEAAIRILKFRDIPILFLSGHNESEIVDRTYQIGAYGYILKNAGETVLLASLRMAFKLYETHCRQQEMEQKLKDLQTSYGEWIRKAPVSIFIVQEGIYTFANEEGAALFGYESSAELVGVRVEDTIDPEYRETIRNRIETLLSGSSNPPLRIKIRHKDGTIHWIESASVPVKHLGKPAGLVIARDISNTVVMEEKLHKESLLYSSRYDLLEYSFNRRLPEVLQKAVDTVCNLTGSPIGFFHFLQTDSLGNHSVYLHAWSTATVEQYCTAKGSNSHYPLEQAGVWADCARIMQPVIHNDYSTLTNRKGYPEGHPALIRELTVPVIRENQCVAILGVGNKPTPYNQEDVDIASRFSDLAWDIVERKTSELTLQRSEEEQRSLLKELRHRTRNTFHQIISLATLQADQETQAQTRGALLDMRNRVSVLAGLYEALQEQGSSTVSLQQLIQRVCSSLSEAFAFRTKQRLTYEAQSITMDARSASAFGLILNELITNAYKHAFPEGREGEIRVSLVRKEDQAVLVVEDNGVGFDSSVREKSEGHFGLELIDTLVTQLGA